MADERKNEYLPDEVSLPGVSLLDTLEALGMTQAELADRMGRPRKTINEIVKGKAGITAQTALQLEKVLGISASFWTNRERLYQEYVARRQEASVLRRWLSWANRYPAAEMEKRRWISRPSDGVGKVRELLRFFGVATPAQLEPVGGGVRFRKSAKGHEEVIQVWLRRGVIGAQEISCLPFDEKEFEAVLSEARTWTRLTTQDFKDRVVSGCAKAGVAVVFVPELPGCGVHGATRWLSSTKAILQLSLFRKYHDQLVFTFFHEAEHILRHERSATFVETAGTENDPAELDANRFAGERLIPSRTLKGFLDGSGKVLSAAKVQAFAESIGICPGIVVGRLQHDRVLPYSHLNHLKRKVVWGRQG